MTDCHQIDSLLTAFVDGDLSTADCERVDRHLLICRLCRGRVRAERAVQELLRARRPALRVGSAPPILRSRCLALSHIRVKTTLPWTARLLPFGLAAALTIIVGGAFVYILTERSASVLAAELTADHVKCFRVVNSVFPTHDDEASVEQAMASRFDWHVHLPEHADRAGLELVGARQCLYGEGLAAHVMYLHNGIPVSLFMLPKGTRREEVVEVLGHQAAIWSAGDRTFVLVAQEPRADVSRMTSFVQAQLR
jgi:anti-sigma factor RsiW